MWHLSNTISIYIEYLTESGRRCSSPGARRSDPAPTQHGWAWGAAPATGRGRRLPVPPPPSPTPPPPSSPPEWGRGRILHSATGSWGRAGLGVHEGEEPRPPEGVAGLEKNTHPIAPSWGEGGGLT